ncbi:MAG TPA: Flp family type IVb pilin [Armatimonadetes bacterium]|nr:Flp family type IVb pilin [Armatimonadota bacterium]
MIALWKDEAGLATVEYALLLALVVVAGITAWSTLGATLRNVVMDSADTIAGPPG